MTQRFLPCRADRFNIDCLYRNSPSRDTFSHGDADHLELDRSMLDLQMHAAGYLLYTDGSLYYRGIWAIYWSSTQSSVTYGWDLIFNSGALGMDSRQKTHGLTVRCLRN